MDVGTEGLATGQVWNLPNLSPAAYPLGQTTTYSSVAVTSTPNYESFTSEDVETGVVTNPAAAYEISSGFYQILTTGKVLKVSSYEIPTSLHFTTTTARLSKHGT
jgi:hypothetical protein